MLYVCMYLIQDSLLVLHTSQQLLSSTLTNLTSEPFMNVEVVLRLFYMLGEVIKEKVSDDDWEY